MSCSRLTRDHRSCRRDAADWPPYDGMPDPVAACWGHLTNTEREQCQAARRRRSQESRQHYERLRAEREARGELDPKPVFREARPCIGQCITCADQWDRENPASTAWNCVQSAHCQRSRTGEGPGWPRTAPY
ncbi:hypothetical protein GCM10010384_45250 [Streptomyces djakartensis]|uniref:Uncharacterized protein n=1 Tax=Streptomyces djakartensis TaxID=68193 RepID=A0ABQ3A5I1_9ACTN|nr:hypothetical protein GCM10010384_45250 [Streptomyces djakartensis]